jgi:hypothetical protein
MAVWARTDEPAPRVGSFLVRSDSPGITIEPTWDHLGLRASRSDDVTFADTPVPVGAIAALTEPAAASARDAARPDRRRSPQPDGRPKVYLTNRFYMN